MGYSAAAPPPIVTVEEPRSAPKPLPQIVTQTPWFFCPPVLGPLSRSEKKMRGGNELNGVDWARRPKGTARNIPITNKGANFMKGYFKHVEGRKQMATAYGNLLSAPQCHVDLHETAVPQGNGRRSVPLPIVAKSNA